VTLTWFIHVDHVATVHVRVVADQLRQGPFQVDRLPSEGSTVAVQPDSNANGSTNEKPVQVDHAVAEGTWREQLSNIHQHQNVQPDI
jgi:hypothetical protein